MLNLSALFYNTLDNPSFLAELDLLPHEKEYINQAKNEIRTTLRASLKECLSKVLHDHGLSDLKIEPKFYIQGSWAYKTLNRPHTTPPQQSDLDDGVYLPMSIMKEHQKPSVASALFFEATEAALAPLVKEKKVWRMSQKPTCIRIEISDFAHIDIPLYAIPDEDFLLLKESMEARGYAALTYAMDSAKDRWTALPTDHVLLAHREDDWIKSDPRAMKEWFVQAVEDHGPQLRRVVRYLKAFRDKTWSKGGPSSILLMAAAVSVFEQRRARDDQALRDVVRQIPAAFREGVRSPIDAEVYLTDSLTPDELEDAAVQFEAFFNYLDGAINASDKQTACNWMRHVFGTRFPNRADLVIAVSVSEIVQATPAEPGPHELVKTTKAG
ncbi:cyclic GMP-AMP synthase DncV-like nucleotidyltransferase [Pseudomonas sp. KB-10]|uniref:CBASS cGAMP synthase n=1 Tax=Pseudomonas sp. KB-10 TaxID=2292264 RepID=UPI001BAE58F1|nr:hypothetical protein [Pseudomonas sp. KB-10]